jgi:hypothetical protein
MSEKSTKSTTLVGYFATGDHECFVFDRHKDPIAHSKAVVAAGGYEKAENCRTYPDELIPEGTAGRRGTWTITVEFEPHESTTN